MKYERLICVKTSIDVNVRLKTVDFIYFYFIFYFIFLFSDLGSEISINITCHYHTEECRRFQSNVVIQHVHHIYKVDTLYLDLYLSSLVLT